MTFILCILFRIVFFYPICSRISSLVTFFGRFSSFILLHHYISKLPKYFCSNFLVFRSLSQTIPRSKGNNYPIWSCSLFNLLVKNVIFLLNVSLSMTIIAWFSFCKNHLYIQYMRLKLMNSNWSEIFRLIISYQHKWSFLTIPGHSV